MASGMAAAPRAALETGREQHARQEWGEAYAALRDADSAGELDAADLARLAISAYLSGHDAEACDAWARAHRAHTAAAEVVAAMRCAVWLGAVHLMLGQPGHAHGWLARVRNAAAGSDAGSLAAGYVEQAAGLEALFSGDPAAAVGPLDAGARAGQRHGDADLAALGRLGCGQALIMTGRVAEGVPMLDEAMVAVSAGEVSPVAAGLIYCAVIEMCREVFELRRAQEWTAALTDWCAAQPSIVPYRGQCLVHRAELSQLRGAWTAASAEAEEATQRLRAPPHPALGAALYQQAELHRLRGERRAAELAYRQASDAGHGAQPGLALLRLAQGRIATAATAISRALAEPRLPADRARLLAARVEILLAGHDVDGARAAADELGEISGALASPPLLAAAANDATGAVLLAAGEPHAALPPLREAWTIWHELDAPYHAACTRVQSALACRRLGDDDTATMELDAARQVFARLGAAPDVARVDALRGGRGGPSGLTAREIEVLGLIAKGGTNREIAAALVISEKTVARHVHNILTKLGVASRAAATGVAYEHGLM